MTSDKIVKKMAEGRINQPAVVLSGDQLIMHESARIDSFCVINASGGLKLRRQSVIHAGSHVIGNGSMDMGPRSVITYNCVILTSTADLRYPASTVVPNEERREISGEIHLERETFVGSGAVIMPDVTLHEGAAVAANSYVDEDVPAWTVLYPDGSMRERN